MLVRPYQYYAVQPCFYHWQHIRLLESVQGKKKKKKETRLKLMNLHSLDRDVGLEVTL